MSEAPTINLRPPVPNAVYKGSEHLFVQRLGVDLTDARPVTMKSILADVAHRTGYSIGELKGPLLHKGLARARQEAMWLMVKAGKWSYPQIGLFMGGRDHSTVWYAYHAWEARENGVVNPAFGRHQDRHKARKARIVAQRMAAE